MTSQHNIEQSKVLLSDAYADEGVMDIFSGIYYLRDCLMSEDHDSDLLKRSRWRRPLIEQYAIFVENFILRRRH